VIHRSRRAVRVTQIGFIVLLLACSAQLAYWMADEFRYTATVRDHRRAAYEDDARWSAELLRSGVPWAQIVASHPEIQLDASGTPQVSPAMLAQLDAERFHRLNRYAWEGAFFLAVLLAAMAVVYTALRDESELRRRQEDFLAAASHELKSPLASLRLSVETMAMRDPPPARRAELVQRLLSDLGRLDQMIANVLSASSLASGQSHSSREQLDLAPIITAVTDELRPLADDGNVKLFVDVPAELSINADREGVESIVRNLVHNSIKASRASAGTVTVRAGQELNSVVLLVEDTGIGFDPREAPRLFEKFYRIEANGHERLPGTGLGLYLVRRSADLDDATVSAHSPGPDRGARFSVQWPAARRSPPVS
jgi:signal transduction histidine kinase